VAAFRLAGPPISWSPVGGAWSHRVFRLETRAGRYAVKELRDPWRDPKWPAWLAAAFAFEMRAWEAGVAMPEPIPAPDGGCVAWVARVGGRDTDDPAPVRVHRWADGVPAPDGAVSPEVASWAGSTLATMHGLAVRPRDRTPFPVPSTATVDRWASLAAMAHERGAPWAGLLTDARPATQVTAELFHADREAPDVMSHGDVDQKNIVLTESSPVLCDWDVAAPVVPRQEVGDVALSLAAWRRFDIAADVVRAYRAAGGEDVRVRPTDLGRTLVVSLDWIAFNVERALGLRDALPAEAALANALVPRLLADYPRHVGIAVRIETLLA
jgi:Ser/Thr protein kinase RdoA (MazF antagonist)